MPIIAPNPFPAEHPAHGIYDALTAKRVGDAPLLPKRVYDDALVVPIRDLSRAGAASDNVAALLHLLNDDLDAAHILCQGHEGDPTANYIHQIVHRREGDWGNTRYWVGKTGAHPYYADLAPLAAKLGLPAWDANAMVAAAARGEHYAAGVSDAETQGLLTWCVTNGR